jgi:hypothetical protein
MVAGKKYSFEEMQQYYSELIKIYQDPTFALVFKDEYVDFDPALKKIAKR